MDSENVEITVVKKKRGRKPKNKNSTTTEVKIPKKRGRKPTGKIIKLKSSEISTLSHDENCIIAHIPLKPKDVDKISSIYSKSSNISTSKSSVDEKISSIVQNNLSDDENTSESSSINELSLDSNSLGHNKTNFSDKYIKHLEKKINDLKLKIKLL